MKKEILIFGAYGALGRGVSEVIISKDYDKIYLFGTDVEKNPFKKDNLVNIKNGDLSVEENVAEAFRNLKPSREKIFFLYTTAGGFTGGKTLWDTDNAEWDRMFRINLQTSYFIARYFSLLVMNSAGGSICFTAAMTGLTPEVKKAAYGSSKSALIHLVKSLALEGQSINMSANAIAPYIIDTPANREWAKNGDFESWIKPGEIGELAHNLFSNFYFITGNIIKLTYRFKIFS